MRRILSVFATAFVLLATACGIFGGSQTARFKNGATIALPYCDVDLVVAGAGEYVLNSYPRNHPMGGPDYCDGTISTTVSRHTFTTGNGVVGAGGEVVVDGVFYARPPGTTGRWTITINAQGVVATMGVVIPAPAPPVLPIPPAAPVVPAVPNPN